MSYIARHIYTIILVLAGIAFLLFCYPFMGWILLAGIVSFALKPFQNKLMKKYKMGKKLSVYLILSSILLFFIPFILSFVTFFAEGRKLADNFKGASSFQSVDKLVSDVYERVPSLNRLADHDHAVNFLNKTAEKAVQPMIKVASLFFLSLPNLFLGLFIFSLSLYYFIADSKEIHDFVLSLEMIKVEDLEELVQILQTACQSTVFAAFITGAVQALILSATVFGLGIQFFFTTLFICMFLAQIPIVGTAPVAIGYIAYFYFAENTFAIVVMIVASVVAGLSDNVIRPWVLSRYDSLHPFAGLISSIGALIIFGPIGVLLGPVITLLFVKVLKKQYRKIII